MSDVPALAGIGAETFIDTFGHIYAAEDLARFLAQKQSPAFYEAFLADAENAVWIGENDDGEVIGYCTAGPCSLPVEDMPPRSGELHRLYLRKSARGSGLGKAFMNIALEWLEGRFDELYVGVFSENVRAQKLYQHCGFEKVAEYHFMVGDHADLEWIMKKSR
ncbi:MAG: GNAT family N-acetyltransferase [Parvularculaceae bacterium]